MSLSKGTQNKTILSTHFACSDRFQIFLPWSVYPNSGKRDLWGIISSSLPVDSLTFQLLQMTAYFHSMGWTMAQSVMWFKTSCLSWNVRSALWSPSVLQGKYQRLHVMSPSSSLKTSLVAFICPLAL